ncbi:hypothetical protein TH53_07790 [Pedobacter lusitanus]|uniref:Contig29, whole genome shotgun sequence n=2 Tax=Pedobacter lusitanus TaxID=1503925 RepID=A0A0D0GKS8_9SPHI|nr:hypothetical protein TH53_07790 [Pedobacter lusitanus]
MRENTLNQQPGIYKSKFLFFSLLLIFTGACDFSTPATADTETIARCEKSIDSLENAISGWKIENRQALTGILNSYDQLAHKIDTLDRKSAIFKGKELKNFRRARQRFLRIRLPYHI